MPITWTLQKWLKSKRGLTRPTDISRAILQSTGFQITSQAITDLFTARPKMLRLETVQAICDTFQCDLSDFCVVTPHNLPPHDAPSSPIITRPIILSLTSYSVQPDENLRSFIARIKLAAIEQTMAIEGNSRNAGHRLRYSPSSLRALRARLKSKNTTTDSSHPTPRPQLQTEIFLAKKLFVVKKTEGLQTFIARIQLATITSTVEFEGNKTRAANRLGYPRTSLQTLLRRLTLSSR